MKTYEEKKEELKGQLIIEMIRLAKQGRGVSDHKEAIEYLTTGKVTGSGDLVEAAMNDFECLYSDYCN